MQGLECRRTRFSTHFKKTNDPVSPLSDPPPEEFSRQRQIRREEADESLAFAREAVKHCYDKRQQLIQFRPGTSVYLNLHEGYIIPGNTNRKPSNERAGPFRVLHRVGGLAYQLELPETMKIISVAHFEPAPTGNSYDRPKPSRPPPAQVDRDEIAEDPSCEIGKLFAHRDYGRGHKRYWTYLVEWKGYEPMYKP